MAQGDRNRDLRRNLESRGTVCVHAARLAVGALEERGIATDPVLRKAALTRDALSSIDARLPFENVSRLWEIAATEARDPSFGVHLAEALPLGGYDIIDYLFAASLTVRDGLERLAHYVRLLYDRSNLSLIVEPDVARMVRRVPVPAPQFDEFSMTLVVMRSRQASAIAWSPQAMTFQHERSHDDDALDRVLGCPVSFGAGETEMVFAPSILHLPHLHADSGLLAILTRYADTLLPPSSNQIVALASSTIAHRIRAGLPSLSATASTLSTPVRTLQRRLAEYGTNYSRLLDQVRRDLALQYIGNASLSIAEIALILHFSDTTAFHRAFRRWTGQAPTQYRNLLFK